MIIVRSYPWSASASMPQPLAEFTYFLVDLSDVWPEATGRGIDGERSCCQRAATVDAFVCSVTGVEQPDLACKQSLQRAGIKKAGLAPG